MNTKEIQALPPQEIAQLVQATSDREPLEAIGQALTVDKLLYLLQNPDYLSDNSLRKLPPIMVGVPHEVFTQALRQASAPHLEVLCADCASEALQHHLTTLTHELQHQLDAAGNRLQELETLITSEEQNALVSNRESTYEEIHSIEGVCHQTMDTASKVLRLAWAATRTDLIEKLSTAKEGAQRMITRFIGRPRHGDMAPTGIYAVVEERLFSIFGDPNNATDFEALADEEPALEAISKFGIWYLQDYREIGLLPFDDQPHDPSQREAQFQQARKNLEKVGLVTVGDLKRASILTREALKEYLAQHLST